MESVLVQGYQESYAPESSVNLSAGVQTVGMTSHWPNASERFEGCPM